MLILAPKTTECASGLLAQDRHLNGTPNVVVTATGCLVMSNVPRTTEEIEAHVTGAKEWVGTEHKLREYVGLDWQPAGAVTNGVH